MKLNGSMRVKLYLVALNITVFGGQRTFTLTTFMLNNADVSAHLIINIVDHGRHHKYDWHSSKGLRCRQTPMDRIIK